MRNARANSGRETSMGASKWTSEGQCSLLEAHAPVPSAGGQDPEATVPHIFVPVLPRRREEILERRQIMSPKNEYPLLLRLYNVLRLEYPPYCTCSKRRGTDLLRPFPNNLNHLLIQTFPTINFRI